MCETRSIFIVFNSCGYLEDGKIIVMSKSTSFRSVLFSALIFNIIQYYILNKIHTNHGRRYGL